MKKIIRYCDKCKKETREYLKILLFKNPTKLKGAKSHDFCNECASKILKELGL